MPTVATGGPYRFVVNTRGNDFEPPHVHVFVGNEHVCRIELVTGRFMENPPPGLQLEIGLMYSKHCVSIQRAWDEIHGD